MYDRQPFGNIEEGILYFHFKFSYWNAVRKKMQNLGKHLFKGALSFWTLPVGGEGVRLDDLWQRYLTVFFLTFEEHNACQVPP